MTPKPRLAPDDPPIAGWQHIQLALRTADSFQHSIRHADAKIAAVFSCVCGTAGFAATQGGSAAEILAGGRPYLVAAVLLTIATVIGIGHASWHLATALRPQLTGPATAGPARANRFGFPSLAGSTGPPGPANAAQQAEEGWELAMLLARIAMVKHRKVQRSLPWAALAATGAAGWQVLATLVSALGAVPGVGP
jgi:hypothetical protein